MTAMAALTSKIIRAASPLGQNGAKWITRDFSKTRAPFYFLLQVTKPRFRSRVFASSYASK